MEPTNIAHSGAPANNRAHEWQPEQVQSGPISPGRAPLSLAKALGWFSVGLGMVELLAPERVTKLVGAPDTARSRRVTQLMGARELMHGIGILGSDRPTPWVWSRVMGDALDIGALGRVLTNPKANTARAAGAIAAVAGTTAADLYDSMRLRSIPEPMQGEQPSVVRAAVTIDRSADDLYRYWRDFENLPDVMTHLQSVEHVREGVTRWTARLPLGRSVSWEAEVVRDIPGEAISWRSLPDAAINVTGELRFVPAPRDRGTELHVWLTYQPAPGPVGTGVLKLFGDEPVQQVKDDLRRFKQVLETGQVVRSNGAPRGTDARLQPKQPAAQPMPV